MKRLKVWLLLGLIFAAGFISGVVCTRVVVRHIVSRAIEHPELVRIRIERYLSRKLDLDADQRRQVSAILMESQTRLRDVRQSVQPQFQEIFSNAEEQVSALLTPAQREQFKKVRRNARWYWKPTTANSNNPGDQ